MTTIRLPGCQSAIGSVPALRGQVSLEFLLIFTATLAVVSMMAAAIIAQSEAAEGKIGEAEAINKAGCAAAAVEAVLDAGGGMEFDFRDEGISYSVEKGKFHVRYRGKMIEVKGVFADDGAEPV